MTAGSSLNAHGQPVGPDLGDWTPPQRPPWVELIGRTVTLQPMAPEVHGPKLFAAFADAPDSLWTYLPWGPYTDADDLIEMLTEVNTKPDWMSWAVVVDGRALGFCSYLRITAPAGSIEIGGIAFSPHLQQTTAATEALSLLMAWSFELGYRRCEWKCDDLNGPSRSAALRLGYTFEGTFRNATHYKGRSRDTAWFGITDNEWPRIAEAHTIWLAAENFDADGQQRTALAAAMPA